MLVRMSGRDASSRVEPQELLLLSLQNFGRGEGFFVAPEKA